MENCDMKWDDFGCFLLEKLEAIYKRNVFSIEEFGMKAYHLWHTLLSDIEHNEPFWTLSYADDCLLYGDEKAFCFYKN